MEPGSDIRTAGLDAVRRRRAELREAASAVEKCLAAPASGRAVIWGERVHDALAQLAADFAEHVALTEGPDGLHQAILAGDLRLANAVATLAAEHAVFTADLATLLADTEAPVTPNDVAGVRDRAVDLIGQLLRHRQRGADLIYEAYQTDVGGAG